MSLGASTGSLVVMLPLERSPAVVSTTAPDLPFNQRSALVVVRATSVAEANVFGEARVTGPESAVRWLCRWLDVLTSQ